MLRGNACIALFQRRRHWAALVAAVLPLGRARLRALPQRVGPPKARRSNPLASRQRIGRGVLSLPSPARLPALDFVGLMTRLIGRASNRRTLVAVLNCGPKVDI